MLLFVMHSWSWIGLIILGAVVFFLVKLFTGDAAED